MALCPGAVLKLLPANASQPRIRPRLIIKHTAVDGQTTTSLYDWWRNPSSRGLESHFYVAKDGTVEQYVDTEVRADANAQANGFAISIETWDGRAPDKPANPWTPAQLAALIRLDDWLCSTHGIPRQIAPSWDGAGIGWHSQFRQWSTSGTACPGQPRVDQIVHEIVPALNGNAPQSEEDIDMTRDELLEALKSDEFVGYLGDRFIKYFADPTINPGTIVDSGLRSSVSGIETAVLDPVSGLRASVARIGSANLDVGALADQLRESLGGAVVDELVERLGRAS
jgi:hypothetical protein